MSYRMLIVEDDNEITSVLANYFTKAGYIVNWASNGREGLIDSQRETYDIILLDLMMPEMDGFEYCKNIRLTSEVPIIVTSAKFKEEDKVKALSLGADDYVVKPFSLVELMARVESNLRRYKKNFLKDEEGQKLEYKDGLVILKEQGEISIMGEKVHLTSKEFALINLMAQNPQKTFAKKELYEYVWGEKDVEGNNTVTVHIKAIREKFKDDIKNPRFIQTVWGSGYKFIGERIL